MGNLFPSLPYYLGLVQGNRSSEVSIFHLIQAKVSKKGHIYPPGWSWQGLKSRVFMYY